MFRYYAVQVLTGQELKIKRNVESIYGNRIAGQDVELIIPYQACLRKLQKGLQTNNKNLLPGYILLKCQDLNDALYYALKRVKGVCRILREDIVEEQIRHLLGNSRSYYDKARSLARHLQCKKGDKSILFIKWLQHCYVYRARVVKVIFQNATKILSFDFSSFWPPLLI